jgi:hypothetical protein
MRARITLLCVLLTVTVAATAVARDKNKAPDYTKHPGYVDFNALEIFGDQDATIEVYLKQPMLNLLRKFFKDEDPELYDVFGRLQLVRIQVFDVTQEVADRFDAESAKTVKILDKAGWERVVRVNHEDQRVFVYLKPSDEYEFIQGVVVIAMEDLDEAVFVNIVGDIRPDDISRLGGHFGVDELDSIRGELDSTGYEVKKGN